MSEVVATAQQGLAGKYKPYPQYKDSGVEWLGVIPTHWSLHALKRTVSGCSNGIWGDEPKGEDDLIVLRVADFDRNKLTVSDDKLTYRSISEKERKTRLLKKGDLLIEKSGGGEKTLVGCVVIFDKDYSAVTSNFVAKMSPRKTYCSNFLRYAFSHLYAGRVNYPSIKQTTGIQNLDSDSYLMEHFCFPDSSDQQTIAAFLDYETARIDRLIAQQQRLIELLKEKRQAVISHAVTKGLNPNAPMKDSGIDWLDQVPEHWSVGRYKFCNSRIIVGIAEAATHAYVDHGVPLIRSTNIKESGLDCSDVLYLDPAFAVQNFTKKLRAKDIVTVRTGYPGISAVLPSELDNSQCFTNLVATPLPQQESDFLCEYLNSAVGKSYFDLNAWGSAQKNISVPILQNFPVAWPSKVEQFEIVLFCKKTKQKYNRLIDNAMKGIDLLQERRTALISAAVTGKIDLRGWTPPAEEAAT